MVYTFTKALGGKIGNSICEHDYCDYALEILSKAKQKEFNSSPNRCSSREEI